LVKQLAPFAELMLLRNQATFEQRLLQHNSKQARDISHPPLANQVSPPPASVSLEAKSVAKQDMTHISFIFERDNLKENFLFPIENGDVRKTLVKTFKEVLKQYRTFLQSNRLTTDVFIKGNADEEVILTVKAKTGKTTSGEPHEPFRLHLNSTFCSDLPLSAILGQTGHATNSNNLSSNKIFVEVRYLGYKMTDQMSILFVDPLVPALATDKRARSVGVC